MPRFGRLGIYSARIRFCARPPCRSRGNRERSDSTASLRLPILLGEFTTLGEDPRLGKKRDGRFRTLGNTPERTLNGHNFGSHLVGERGLCSEFLRTGGHAERLIPSGKFPTPPNRGYGCYPVTPSICV